MSAKENTPEEDAAYEAIARAAARLRQADTDRYEAEYQTLVRAAAELKQAMEAAGHPWPGEARR